MATSAEALMARMAAGETAALDEFLEKFQGAAYRFAYRMFRDRHIAEDVSQEFFFKMFRNAHRYEPVGKFTTYFYRVLNNLCLDTLRKMNRKSMPAFQSFENPVLDGMADTGDEGAPELGARRTEEKRLVREAIDSLAPNQRRVIVLRELEELKYREIAEVMSVSLNEVKVLIHRARKNLVKVMKRSPLFEGRES